MNSREEENAAEVGSTSPSRETGEQPPSGEGEADVEPTKDHPIARAIDTFLHRARDIRQSARIFVPAAIRMERTAAAKIQEDFEHANALLGSTDRGQLMVGVKLVENLARKVDRLAKSQVPLMLEASLYLGLFSAFDAFTGELLRALYERRPELFNRVKATVPVSEILKFSSFDELKETVLRDQIESFRRKSYVEQFDSLEETFGVKLKAFSRWPQFVEAGQRRNLITHCDGIVSEQYLKICSAQGCDFEAPVKVGDRVGLGPKYMMSSCDLLMEVALKLGHTLWRKVLPGELKDADRHLNDAIYEENRRERWAFAQVIGEFAVDMHRHADDANEKVAIVNYSIALKFGGREADAAKQLGAVDWSASLPDFRLAEAVLSDRFDDAAALMKRIGKRGEFVSEHAFHTWPLFRAFRQSDQFLATYERIYGYPFVTEVKRSAEAQAEAVAAAAAALPLPQTAAQDGEMGPPGVEEAGGTDTSTESGTSEDARSPVVIFEPSERQNA